MKKLFCILIVALLTPLLSGCPGSKGSSAPPPTNIVPTPGDGRVVVEWTPVPGVDYWIFSATNPSLTAFNWTSLPHAYAQANVATPYYMCGLLDGDPYYFAMNGRTNGGPGGASSPTSNATLPYNASSGPWSPNSTLPSTYLYGVGYTSLTTCANNATLSATGMFAAVGAGGTIFTSYDGKSWSQEVTTTSNDLYAVAGYAPYQNNLLAPGLRWMAVGAAGQVVYYEEGNGWVDANTGFPSSNYPLSAANPGNNALRSVILAGSTFFAVGDAGTIISSLDAINWYRRPYATTNPVNATTQNLNGVTYGGGVYVAVGGGGTILTSGDGNLWTPRTPTTPISGINLQKVASYTSLYGNIYVAVGDNGTVVTSTSVSGGTLWTTHTITGTPNLVGITVEARAVETNASFGPVPTADTNLGFISSAQFVAIDSSGNTWTSPNGWTWTAGPGTGITPSPLGQPLVSSGFGYISVGSGGASAYAF